MNSLSLCLCLPPSPLPPQSAESSRADGSLRGFTRISASDEDSSESSREGEQINAVASLHFIMDLWTSRRRGTNTRLVLMLVSWCVDINAETCHRPLVSSLSPSSFRSSSQLSSSHGPGFAKLNRREGAGGWSPLDSDKYQWLEVDLGGRTQITSVATQGRYGSSDWQTAYQLMFSDTGHNWRQYRWEGRIGAFPGNSNADSVVQHNLQHPVIARFVRVAPLRWNPNGRIGLRLEAYGCPYNSDTVSFDGDSSLIFKLSQRPRQTSTNTIRLTFKTMRNSGFLLHAEGQNELGLTLEFQDGRLLLLLRKGKSSRQHLVSLGSLLDDQHWHRVAVEQHGSHFNLTVDKNTKWVVIPPWFTHWDYDQMTVGADQNLDSQNSNRNFHGCVENLLYDGQNLIGLAKQRDQSVTAMGNVTFSCSEPVFVAVTFTGPRSFLRLPGDIGLHSAGVSLGLQFRTWDTEGLLLTFDLPKRDGTVWLHLRDAKVHLQIHKAGRPPVELKAGSCLNDGQWHSVDLRSRQHLTVTVDGTEVASASPTYPITPGGHLFYGGCPAEGNGRSCRNPSSAFQGCMRLLTVEDELVDLIKVQQRLMGDYSNLQIDMCGIMDRCSPSYCEHGGSCTQSWGTFDCNCSGTGYGGATCHSSIYERSCEAYKHRGNTSGYYYIDADGSGPIKPQLLFCNMTEDETWTVVQHNNTELTKIQPSTERSQHLTHFEYAADEEQLMATINQSEYCEQELAYHCRKSRLLNSPEGGPLSWWVGGPGTGQRQTYWGGALPGSQQCACSLQENCLDPKRHCNCDADRTVWSSDSGLLTHKESLPVRSLVLGDVRRPGSESSYQVGPLRCYGDKSIWNAAFFAKETSYLHFPTFHGELSADISLLFKTTSSSGVLLENLGIRDFIRLELSSPTEVVFSFDVGNGPLEVSVKAGVPLNDDRWHRIQAERNVREASLRLDELPAATQEAPADGHIHLQLNSQLFVGGTASRQKGFRGCIRSLQLNGVTLDLEERAKVTPGVQAGCPGHCGTYGGLCQNQGRCVEGTRSFSCDCSSSAFTGAFCDQDVSVAFEPETSLSYSFEENLPNESNGSSSSHLSPFLPNLNLRGENVSLSFRSAQSPALFLYVSSRRRQYLALLLNKQEQLEVRYRLESSREEEILRSRVRSLANGQLHSVSVSRLADSVTIQVDQHSKEHFNMTSGVEFSDIRSLTLGRVHNSQGLDPALAQLGSLGFAGCLSAVLFNSISPLKAALLRPRAGSVVVRGPLIRSSCGPAAANPHAAENTHHQPDQSGSVGGGQPLVNALRSDSALIGGLIVVIFGIVAALAILIRFLYRRKGTCQNQELTKTEDSNRMQFTSQTISQFVPTESQKEYFI
ncbi:contactin-associated protein-like 4 [Xiphophorus hellerii]|uniref:contactin-associated protein-like 4 n=1 Tax=Xiphophorus hellerii TaxID=8084 RepID=UPI0013B3D6DB|nr:contactin-associated protein-like 4 [Xiphophorus hellerii]